MHWYLPRLLSSPVVAKHNFQVNVSFRATTASGYKMVLQDMPLSSPLPITDIGEIPVMPHILCHSQSFSPSVVSSTLQLNSRSQNCYFNTIESLTLTHNLFTITLTVTPPKTSRPPTWLYANDISLCRLLLLSTGVFFSTYRKLAITIAIANPLAVVNIEQN